MTTHIELAFTGEIERQRQRETEPRAYLARAFEDLLGADQVRTAKLIVRSKLTPVRSLWSVLPKHLSSPLVSTSHLRLRARVAVGALVLSKSL